MVRTLLLALFIIIFASPVFAQLKCDNWLFLPSQPAYVQVGDLDVAGDQITVEAVFNRTAPWTGSDLYQGDLVSKHYGPPDCNYLLRPGSAEITTSRGYFKTPEICDIELNKTYHVAMVYNGRSLKFYRNGELRSEIAATGNLFQNDWKTQIGLIDKVTIVEQLVGYINEVKIWNVARTQTQIRQYMQSSIPNPTTETGLVAYYTFDNLINKQGNSAWNGTLVNGQINQVNPSCVLAPEPCPLPPCVPGELAFSGPTLTCDTTSSYQYNITRTGNIDTDYSFIWDGQDQNVTNKTANSFSIKYNEAGNKVLKVAYNNRCKDTIQTLAVDVKLSPRSIDLGPAVRTCKDTTIQLNAGTGFSSYLWNDGNTGQINQINQPGTYSIQATNFCGSPVGGTFVYEKVLPGNLSFNGPETICDTSLNVQFDITRQGINNSSYNFIWDNNPQTITTKNENNFGVRFKDVGQTNLKISYNNNCKDTITNKLVDIILSPKQINLGVEVSSCKDTVIVLDAGAGFKSYQWQDGSIEQIRTVSTAGNYSVTALNFCDQPIRGNFSYRKIQPVPFTVTPAEVNLCSGNIINFEASGGDFYSWQPASLFNNPQGSNPTGNFSSDQNVQLYIIDNFCGRDTVINIPVTIKKGEQKLVMPNAFTPNNDGKNDLFKPFMTGNIKIYDLQVYNRWGQLIYKSQNALSGWDGKMNNQFQPEGTYIYVIKVEDECNDIKERKGSFLLIR